jgi:hypothetical protein
VLADNTSHGLHTSPGNEWHSKLSNDLLDMGFAASRTDRDLWITEGDNHYEHVGVFSPNPEEVFEKLK